MLTDRHRNFNGHAADTFRDPGLLIYRYGSGLLKQGYRCIKLADCIIQHAHHSAHPLLCLSAYKIYYGMCC